MRLIDAEELLERYKWYEEMPANTNPWDFVGIENVIGEVPTIDAVPVVRCKDCKHRKTCTHSRRLGINGYCSEGE